MSDAEKIIVLDVDGVLNSNQSIFIYWCQFLGIPVNGRRIYKYGVTKKDWDRLDRNMYLTKTLGFPEVSGEKQPLGKQAVYIFNKLVKKTNAKVLMCSSWRNSGDLSELDILLKEKGVECELIGKTPNIWKTHPKWKSGDEWITPPICKYPFYSGNRRGEEILWWLYTFAPKVKNIAIIDDSWRDIKPLFPNHCVTPRSDTGGLLWKHYEEVLDVIKRPIDVVKMYEDLKNNNKNVNDYDTGRS